MERGGKKSTENTVQLSEYYTLCLANLTFEVLAVFNIVGCSFFNFIFLIVAEGIASGYTPKFLC